MSSGVTERSAPSAASRVGRQGAECADGLALFHRSLAEMCRAQVPLPRALRMVAQDLAGERLVREAEALATEIEAGTPLPQAIDARSRLFPPAYIALVDAGIAAGDLPAVLEEIATDASRRARQTDKLRSALAYPLTAACFVAVVALLLLFFISPSMTALQDVPPIIENSYHRRTGGVELWAIAAAIAVLGVMVILGIRWLRRPLDAHSAPRGLAYRLPLIGHLRLCAAKASFAWSMAMMLRRELPLPKALRLAAATFDDARLARRILRMSERAEAGEGLSEVLREGELLPASLLWTVEAASASNASVQALEDIAEVYRRRFERSVDRVCVLATPLAQLVVGLAVLAFALNYALPSLRFIDAIFGG